MESHLSACLSYLPISIQVTYALGNVCLLSGGSCQFGKVCSLCQDDSARDLIRIFMWMKMLAVMDLSLSLNRIAPDSYVWFCASLHSCCAFVAPVETNVLSCDPVC